MLIEDVRVEPIEPGRVELHALCDGQELYYRVPSQGFSEQAVGDVLLLSTLAPAMLRGSPLRLPGGYPVSSQLASSLEVIQRIWISWNSSLKHVSVEAEQYDPQSAKPADGIGLFYSGGVDSSYSLISHMDVIDVLIISFGFDFNLFQEQIGESVERNGRFAEQHGKDFVWVETNHSQFVRTLGVSRTFMFGATLASMALLLGLRTCYFASSHSAANMRPDGSHPIIDYLFSNGVTNIIHDDVSVSRFAKTSAIAKHPDILDNLRVCWEEHNQNCGVCSKCVRTIAALRLAGVQGPFPPHDVKQFRAMGTNTELEYLVDMAQAAHAQGDRELFRVLKKGLSYHDRKEALRYLDQGFLSGSLQRIFRRFSDSRERLVKVNLRPDLDLR